MSGFDPRSQEDPAAAAAAEWFVRLNGEAATGDDWRLFEQWLRASPAHARAYERLERLWTDIDPDRDALAAALREKPAAIAERRMRPRWAWPAAAALAASVAVAVAVGLMQRPAVAPTLYQTHTGQLTQVILPDGTKVRLNAATRMAVLMQPHARRVQMPEGEAVFDVAHDPARPFLIEVGDREVKVVGTEFDLLRRDGRTELTVRRGTVEVRPAGSTAAPARVTAGESYAHRDGDPAATVAQADLADAFDWTQGQLIYRDRPLSEVAADISRRFGVDVRPADAQTAALRFTGVLVTDNAPEVLRRLEAFTGVTAERTGATVLLREPQSGR